MRTAGKLKNCFICGRNLCEQRWACGQCFDTIIDNNSIVNKIPNYISVNQEEKYLKLLYKKERN